MAKNRAKQLRAFLAQHPICIFCGGSTPGATRDHLPSRQLFHRKDWPEGYEFPSCKACNRATKDAEQVMAMIARVYPNPSSEAEDQEMGRIIKAVANNYPAVIEEMRPSHRQVTRYRSKPWAGQMIDDGRGAAIPLSLAGPLVRQCAEAYGRKLFSALHYKEVSKIIPPGGGILWRWYSNVQRLDDELPDEFITMMQYRPTLQRTKRDLSDQFSYTFVKAGDGELTAYFATFRLSFAMLAFVEMDASRFEPSLSPVLRPLGPHHATITT